VNNYFSPNLVSGINLKNNSTDTNTKQKVPVQKRAEKTVDLILETAAKLIQEVGLEGFNTNLLASQAGVNISTIYRYFPNKNKIIEALYGRWKAKVNKMLSGVLSATDSNKNWRNLFDQGISGYIALVKEEKNFADLRMAMLASPELRIIDNRNNMNHADAFAKAFRDYGVELPEKQLRAITQSFVLIVANMVDFSVMEGQNIAEELEVELRVIYRSYFTNYLD
jgi:AcrR family transcriptional regulator